MKQRTLPMLMGVLITTFGAITGEPTRARAAEPAARGETALDARLPAPLYDASAAAHDAMVGYPPVAITDMEIDPAGCKINVTIRADASGGKAIPFNVLLKPIADDASSIAVESAAGPHAREILDRTLNELGVDRGGRPGKPPRPAIQYGGPQPPADEKPVVISEKPWRVLEGHTGSVMSVTFSPDGRTMASTSRDATVAIWDAAGFEVIKRLKGHVGSVYSAVYSPDGKLLVTCGDDLAIWLWSVPQYELVRKIEGAHTAPVRSLSFSPDGGMLASCSMDRTVRLWDVATGAPIRTMTGHAGALKAVMFSPDGKQLVSAGQERGVRVWDVATGEVVREMTSPEPTHEAAAWSPDGRWIAANGTFGPVVVWEAATGKAWARFADHNVEGDSIAFAPGGGLMAAGHKDQTIDLRNTNDWRLVGRLITEKGRVESLGFTPDGRIIAAGAGGNDERIRVWNLAELGLRMEQRP